MVQAIIIYIYTAGRNSTVNSK